MQYIKEDIINIMDSSSLSENIFTILSEYIYLVDIVENYLQSRENNLMSIVGVEPIECSLALLEIRNFLNR